MRCLCFDYNDIYFIILLYLFSFTTLTRYNISFHYHIYTFEYLFLPLRLFNTKLSLITAPRYGHSKQSQYQYHCNITVKGERQSSISNLTDALAHYRSNAGGSVPATEVLIDEMKKHKSFRDAFGPNGDVTNKIRDKIREALSDPSPGKQFISNERGSYRGLRCYTLGSYSLNIEYNHRVCKGTNHVRLHLYGSDRWDFEYNPNEKFHKNLVNEIIPGIVAGNGTPFDITYNFYHTLEITV